MTGLDVQALTRLFTLPGGEPLLALRNLSFQARAGEFVCLFGPSGCGKTTTLRILAGLDLHYRGSVVTSGEAPRISYVFQEARLLPWLTVRDNVCFVLDACGIARSVQDAHADEWLERVGLGGFADSYPRQLSVGMQQRLAVARAFAVSPTLLLMDEPFSALDAASARQLQDELLRLWDLQRPTVVFVSHNVRECLYLADRVLLFTARPGHVVAEVNVDLPRPRAYDDARLLALAASVERGSPTRAGAQRKVSA